MRRRNVMKLAAAAAVGTLSLAACGNGGGAAGDSGGKIGLAFDVGGRGDKSFNDSAVRGVDKAKKQFSVQAKELSAIEGETDAKKADRLKLLAQTGFNPVIGVGFAYAPALKQIAPQFKDIKFGIVDGAASDVSGPNITNLVFKEEEASYLVGVAAALATKTKNVGFIGGVQTPLIQKFQAGFAAGVAAVDKSIVVQVKYLSQPPDFTGFNDPAKAKVTAQGMYDNKADVIFHAAGGSGAGLFQAAVNSKKLAIGCDSDQYLSAPPDQKPFILTSAMKGVDNAVFKFIEDVKGNKVKAGELRLGLKEDGVQYAATNPALKPFQAKMDDFKKKIISGEIKVPDKPTS